MKDDSRHVEISALLLLSKPEIMTEIVPRPVLAPHGAG